MNTLVQGRGKGVTTGWCLCQELGNFSFLPRSGQVPLHYSHELMKRPTIFQHFPLPKCFHSVFLIGTKCAKWIFCKYFGTNINVKIPDLWLGRSLVGRIFKSLNFPRGFVLGTKITVPGFSYAHSRTLVVHGTGPGRITLSLSSPVSGLESCLGNFSWSCWSWIALLSWMQGFIWSNAEMG